MSIYDSVHRRSLDKPEDFWAEAAEQIHWAQGHLELRPRRQEGKRQEQGQREGPAECQQRLGDAAQQRGETTLGRGHPGNPGGQTRGSGEAGNRA